MYFPLDNPFVGVRVRVCVCVYMCACVASAMKFHYMYLSDTDTHGVYSKFRTKWPSNRDALILWIWNKVSRRIAIENYFDNLHLTILVLARHESEERIFDTIDVICPKMYVS